jgi:hypothetical protein
MQEIYQVLSRMDAYGRNLASLTSIFRVEYFSFAVAANW